MPEEGGGPPAAIPAPGPHPEAQHLIRTLSHQSNLIWEASDKTAVLLCFFKCQGQYKERPRSCPRRTRLEKLDTGQDAGGARTPPGPLTALVPGPRVREQHRSELRVPRLSGCGYGKHPYSKETHIVVLREKGARYTEPTLTQHVHMQENIKANTAEC